MTVATQTKSDASVKTAEDLKKLMAKRTKCEVWTRVMGYHRPVSQFNTGKKSEHGERVHFVQGVTEGSSFACER